MYDIQTNRFFFLEKNYTYDAENAPRRQFVFSQKPITRPHAIRQTFRQQ